MRVLLVSPGEVLPPETGAYLASKGHEVETASGYGSALSTMQHGRCEAVVLPAPGPESGPEEQFQKLLRTIDVHGLAAIVLGEARIAEQLEVGHLVDFAGPAASKEEIQGRLSILKRYHTIVRALERDLGNMQRLFRQLNLRFTEVDQEMRLAGRLQSSFLPRGSRSLEGLSYAALYRPATFVSGDIYDIFRVDEDHVALYVADAVGHGMAASLLTMFIKNALVSKVIHQDHYEVLEPNETLQLLNQKLCDQELPNSQFVTACYALYNTRTRELQYARAGHPYPFLCSPDGTMTELKSPGGLLGLFEGEDFPSQTVTLAPGEKLLLYSDGLEVAFAEAADRPDELRHYRDALKNLADLPADRLVGEFSKLLDTEAGSLNPKDDVTVLVMQVE